SFHGTVWHDTNSDGVLGPTDTVVAGIAIDLYSAADALLGTTTTDANGAYAFANPPDAPGYYLVVRTPAGSTFTTEHARGAAAGMGSDVNSTGYSDLFTPATRTTINAGLTSTPPSYGWTNTVPQDDAADRTVVNHVAGDVQGNVYVTGQFQGTADFESGPGTYDLTSAGNYNVYVAKYSAAGSLVWAT